MTRYTSSKESGFILKIISKSLEIWMRRQCKMIGELRLDINGTSLKLLKGQLSGVSLFAKDVIFQDLSFSLVNLKSGPIKLKLNQERKLSSIIDMQEFQIEGNVVIQSEGINSIFLSKRWRSMREWLAKALLGVNSFDKISIEDEMLILTTSSPYTEGSSIKRFKIKAKDGTILFISEERGLETYLPMDESIQIQEAVLKGNKLQIFGKSDVTL